MRPELIVRTADIEKGRTFSIRGTRTPVSNVLLILAFGGTPSELLTKLHGFTQEGLLATLRWAADLASRAELSLPARAALLRELDRVPSAEPTPKSQHGQSPQPRPDWLAHNASSVLSALADLADADIDALEPLRVPGRYSKPQVQGALTYAAVLAKDQDLPPLDPESPEDRRLRDLLDPESSRLVKDLYRGKQVAFAPEEDLDSWIQTVQEVEAGYVLSIWDYHNDLDVRDRIEKALSLLLPRTHERWRAFVAPWDDRLMRATAPLAVPMLRPWRPLGWWWHRRPTRLQPASWENSGWPEAID